MPDDEYEQRGKQVYQLLRVTEVTVIVQGLGARALVELQGPAAYKVEVGASGRAVARMRPGTYKCRTTRQGGKPGRVATVMIPDQPRAQLIVGAQE